MPNANSYPISIDMNANTYSIAYTAKLLWDINHTFAPKSDHSFIHRVLCIIKENLSDENFFLIDLCRAVHLERTQVYRKVKAFTGKGPSELIREARLYKAKELLLQTNFSIAEIAFQTGFKESSHFTRSYRLYFGETPTEGRKARA